MSKFILIEVVVFLLISFNVYAQNEIPQERSSRQESEGEETSATQDTTELIPVESNLYWYDIHDKLSVKTDSSKNEIYRREDEKELRYMDMSDIFWAQPLWFDFDLVEAGRPAYISLINTYPHQTPLFFGGTLMNDQLQGAFNTQFIPLNFIQFVELGYTAGSLQNYGLWSGSKINITPHSVHTPRPWTKILYKQGSYGYSDVDIHFDVPFTSNFALQLGGKNSSFDGAIEGSGFDGQNYRAEVTWQYSPNLYIRSQIYLNRIKVGLASFDRDQEFAVPVTDEKRNDVFLDVTWLPVDSLEQRLHVLLYYSDYTRKFKNTFSTYTFETWSQRFGVDANYNFLIGEAELLVGAGALLPEVWGDPFDGDLGMPSFNSYGRLNMPVGDILNFRAAIQLAYIKDYDLSILPTLGTDIFIDDNHYFSFDLSRGERIPNITERFFNFDSLYGKSNLNPETISTLAGRYYYRGHNTWHLKIDAGYHSIENEIAWKDSIFSNNGSRDFLFCGIEGFYRFWWLDFKLAGQYTMADLNLTPRSSVWEGHILIGCS